MILFIGSFLLVAIIVCLVVLFYARPGTSHKSSKESERWQLSPWRKYGKGCWRRFWIENGTVRFIAVSLDTDGDRYKIIVVGIHGEVLYRASLDSRKHHIKDIADSILTNYKVTSLG